MKRVYVGVIAAALALVAVIGIFAASFTDIEHGAYYSDAAERMAARGILDGYGDGKYHGDESVTRAHLSALVCKMLGKTDEALALAGKTEFKDVGENVWYTGYINYAVANGIIVGDGDGNFRPDDYVKYEEVVKVVVCVLKLDGDVRIDPADWSKEYIEAADKAGLLSGLIGKKGTVMLRSDIAVICDKAMPLLDAKGNLSETTTTKKSVHRPSSVTTAVTTAPAETTTTRENAWPALPIEL